MIRVVNTPPKVFIQDIIRFMVSDIPSMQSNWLGTFVLSFFLSRTYGKNVIC